MNGVPPPLACGLQGRKRSAIELENLPRHAIVGGERQVDGGASCTSLSTTRMPASAKPIVIASPGPCATPVTRRSVRLDRRGVFPYGCPVSSLERLASPPTDAGSTRRSLPRFFDAVPSLAVFVADTNQTASRACHFPLGLAACSATLSGIR